MFTLSTDTKDDYRIQIDEMKDLESNELECAHFKTENISVEQNILKKRMSNTSFRIRNTLIS